MIKEIKAIPHEKGIYNLTKDKVGVGDEYPQTGSGLFCCDSSFSVLKDLTTEI